MSQRIQPMSADSAKAIIDSIKGNIASISIKALDGLSPSQAATLERLLQFSAESHAHIVEGTIPKVALLQLPSENFGAKNQSDWEGQQLAAQLRPDWRDTAMVVGQKRPDTIRGVAIS